MGIVHFEKEVPADVSPSRMFKAYILDSHNLFPKLAPQAFKSMEFLDGDWGVGTVKLYTFGDAIDFKHSKQRIDELDKENFRCKYTMYEGDWIWKMYEKTVCDVKLEDYGNGGSIYNVFAECHLKGDQEVNEESIKENGEKAMELYKVVEAHLYA